VEKDPTLVALGRLGAHTSWARTRDRTARTAPAREALEAKWLREADGDVKRAESMRKAHYARMALLSAQARARKARRAAGTSETELPDAA
jgi:hypothetical protein